MLCTTFNESIIKECEAIVAIYQVAGIASIVIVSILLYGKFFLDED